MVTIWNFFQPIRVITIAMNTPCKAGKMNMQDKFVVDETVLKRYLSYIEKARTHQDVQKQREYMQMAEDLVKQAYDQPR
jgi:hypothetical protein